MLGAGKCWGGTTTRTRTSRLGPEEHNRVSAHRCELDVETPTIRLCCVCRSSGFSLPLHISDRQAQQVVRPSKPEPP